MNGNKKRPGVVGRWTTQLIYEQLPNGVLDELKKKTPKTPAGQYRAKLFQSLTEDIGELSLVAQLNSIISLMQVSDDWDEFMRYFDKLVNRRKNQISRNQEQLKFNFDDL